MHLHPGMDLLELERLGHEVLGPRPESLDLLLGIQGSAEDDHRDIPQVRPFLDPPAGFQAAHARHPEVQEDHVRVFQDADLQGLGAIRRLQDPVAEVLQQMPQVGADHGFIVNDQDQFGQGHCAPSMGAAGPRIAWRASMRGSYSGQVFSGGSRGPVSDYINH